jgi:hypothetical protein
MSTRTVTPLRVTCWLSHAVLLSVIVLRRPDLPRHDSRHRLQALTARALAGLHRLVDLFVGDDRHLLQVAQQPLELVIRGRLRVVGEESGGAFEHRMQLGEGHHGLMRFLRQQHLVVGAEQAVNETLELLRAHAGKFKQGLARRQDLEARQPERRARVLVFREAVPKAVHDDPHHLLDLVGRRELGQLAAPGLGKRRHRRYLHPGAGNRAQQEGAQRMQRRRAAVARQQGLNVLIGRCAAARRGFG